jgi:hypothetical protein
MKKDWLLMIAWLLVIILAIMIGSVFTIKKINSCTTDPFGFGVKMLKDNFDLKYVYGSVTIVGTKGQMQTEPFGDFNLTIEQNNKFINISLENFSSLYNK